MAIKWEDNFIQDLPDKCWIWVGPKHRQGYGYHKQMMAHRYSYKLYKGEFPKEMHVCHTCDNPSCVNPNHLFLGTHKDNMRDMYAKNRCPHNKGEKHHNAKATPEIVRHIRRKEMTQRAYAKLYGMCQRSIAEIQHRLTWPHVTDQPEIGSEVSDQ